MMGPSHRRLGAAWWLGGVLAANTVGAGIHPLIAFGGAAVAPVFAADTDGLLERGNVRLEERSERTGLRRTVRVLPFAPTTVLLHGVSIVLGALVTWQWISQGSTVGG